MKTKCLLVAFLLLLLAATALPGSVSAMTITVSIPEKYSEVKAGEKVYFETEVKWPENTGRKDLRIEYSVSDKKAEDVAYLKVLKAIETQASFMDSISIPESVAPGMYIIRMKIGDYKDLDQEVAASFRVAKGGNAIQTYLFIIIGLLSVITIIVTGEMFYLTRKHNI